MTDQMKSYFNESIKVGDGYKILLLGDICCFRQKSTRTSYFKSDNGLYNFYTPNGIKKCDIADYNEESLIISSNNENIYIDNVFSCSNNNYIINTPFNLYVYYILSGKKELLNIGYSGNGKIKNLSKNSLRNLQIPIPICELKMNEWVIKISNQYNEVKDKKIKKKEMQYFIKNRMNEIIKQECDEIKLGTIGAIWSGSSLSNDIAIKGDYNVYNGINTSYTHNIYNIEADNIIISKYIDNVTCVKLIKEKNFITNNCYSIHIYNNVFRKYILYYLLYNNDALYKLARGTIVKTISHIDLSNFIVRIPKMLFILELETHFKELETLEQEYKHAQQLYNQYIQQLCEEAIPCDSYS